MGGAEKEVRLQPPHPTPRARALRTSSRVPGGSAYAHGAAPPPASSPRLLGCLVLLRARAPRALAAVAPADPGCCASGAKLLPASIPSHFTMELGQASQPAAAQSRGPRREQIDCSSWIKGVKENGGTMQGAVDWGEGVEDAQGGMTASH
uniref:atherin-like n=1 Tax=Macaca mulatta TaxID=9544 RepID=UPI0010A2471F|nr:atherin-like [Macaca mulatta]